MKPRGAFVWLHRWVGLLMAGFLILVGTHRKPARLQCRARARLRAAALRQTETGRCPVGSRDARKRAQEQLPQAQVTSVTYQEPDQVSVGFAPRNGTDGRTGPELAFDEFYVDPWTGDELGRRKRGDLSQGLINLMPFIYDLHWRLALGDLGQWTLGIVAVLWTIDCFVGFYLTLPPGSKDFWRRWKPAWLIKRNASAYRLNFDLHRAGGLWFWAVLFVFAWSSVMMDIRPAYEWVMRGLFDYHDLPIDDLIMNANADASRSQDRVAGGADAGRAPDGRGSENPAFRRRRAAEPRLFSAANLYLFDARGSRDLFERSPKGGATSVAFDADSGDLVELSQPTGEHLGNTIESWLYALHMARVFGMPYRILVCVLGLVIAMLSVTGVYIWWKKRAARADGRAGRSPSARGSRDIHQVKASIGPSRQ